MQSELSFLVGLTPNMQTLLRDVHKLDRVIADRMNLVAPTQQAEPETPAVNPPVNIETGAPLVQPAPPPPLHPLHWSPSVQAPFAVTTPTPSQEIAAGPNPDYVPPPPQNRLAQLPFSVILSDDFLNSCLWIEDTIGLSAHDLICCMGFETGRTFSPSVKNPGSSATGLIQFMAATAERLGTSTTALSAMDQVHQLNYVFKYFQDFRHRGYDLSKWNLGDTYMAILYPPGIGKSDDTPIFVEGKGANYAANHGLDADKNGFVTRGECLVKISQVETEGMKHRRGGE